MKTLLVLSMLWTYGSEALDNLVQTTDSEYYQFMQLIGCSSKDGQVTCVVDGITYKS